jgi:hypothetical protein
MKKFILLYMAPSAAMQEMMKNSTPEQREQGMAAWNTWMDEHKNDFADKGSAFGKNKRATKDSVEDVRNDITGYSIVNANSQEDAAKIAQGSPNFAIPGAYVEVMEVLDMS